MKANLLSPGRPLATLLATLGFAAIARADLPPVTTGLVAQYDAQAITGLADGDTVNTWNDTSGAGNHATRTAGAPAYTSGAINGQPVVRFPVGGVANFSFPRRTDIRTIFWVISEANTTALHFLMGDSNNYDFHRGYVAAPFKLWDGTYSSPNLRGGTTRLNGTAVNGTSTSLAAGWNLLDVVTSGNVVASYITQDRVYGRQWEGDIAEILIYNTALSGADVAAVEDYLNAKWFTPANTVAKPVISPAGGSYIGAGTATLTCATPGATIYYTMDGTTPNGSSPSGASGLTVPIPAGATTTVQAYGHLDTWTDSALSSITYTTTATLSGTWINPAGGSWTTDTNWQDGAIPSGGTADFSTLDLTVDAVVTLDGTRTLSSLVFGDTTPSHNWAITPGTGDPLTLDASWGTPSITVTNQTATLAMVVAGNKGLVKVGGGTLALTGANTYTGTTALNGGTLQVTNLASHRSSVVTATGTTFKAEIPTNVNAANSFNITGTGTLKKTGVGYWLLGDVGRVGIAMRPGGLLDIQEGTVGTGNHQQSFTDNQGSINIATGATLDMSAENIWADALTGGGSIIMSYTASGARTVTLGVANGSGTFGGVIGSGGYIYLTKTGSGTQVLSGTNTYAGNTTISGGTLQLGDGSTTGSLATSSAITNNATLAFNRSDNISQGVHFSGNAITGTGGITQMGSGTLILTANNTCSGTTTITGGTLQLGNGSTSGALSSSSLITNNGTLTFNRSDNISSGAIDGTGGLTQMGPGTLTLPAANTYTGTTTVNGGKLVINGSLAATAVNVNATGTLGGRGTVGGAISVNDGGTLASGASPGLTTTANVTFTTGSSFAVEINSDSNTADTLTAGGDLTLGNATLAVSNLGTAPIANGSRFIIATYTGNLSGTFNGIPDGGTITVGTTNLTVRYADAGKNITLSLSTPFSKWLTDNYPSLTGDTALPGSDPDGDGLNNIGEFAFKGDPTKGGDRGLTSVLAIDANGNTTRELTLTVAVRSGATFVGTPSPAATIDGVTYTAQGSLDLADAFAAPVTEVTPALTPAQTGLPALTGSGWEYHTFVLTGSEGLPIKGFLRVQAEGQ